MKRTDNRMTYICSPFQPVASTAAEREIERKINIYRATLGCKLALENGYEPMAPHLYFPQFLDDDLARDRGLGTYYADGWLKCCERVWVFPPVDGKLTPGMEHEIALAEKLNIPVRTLDCIEDIVQEYKQNMRKEAAPNNG